MQNLVVSYMKQNLQNLDDAVMVFWKKLDIQTDKCFRYQNIQGPQHIAFVLPCHCHSD